MTCTLMMLYYLHPCKWTSSRHEELSHGIHLLSLRVGRSGIAEKYQIYLGPRIYVSGAVAEFLFGRLTWPTAVIQHFNHSIC